MRSRLLPVLLIALLPSGLKAGEVKDYLMPQPKEVKIQEGRFSFPGGRIISGLVTDERILSMLRDLQRSLQAVTGIYYPVAGIAAPGEEPAVAIGISEKIGHPQGYELSVSVNEITVTASDEAGLAYALLTLKQLFYFQEENGYLPLVVITDWPDFQQRGVMLDISRDKVPTMASLFRYIDQLAAWKINELQLYTEHTFAYRNHQTVWENASPVTADEILQLDAYCKDRFIELVPNQNSFGHMDRWLKHDAYKHLSEAENSGVISPAEPGSLQFIGELYDELLPNFTSAYFNIGCDETDRLGSGKSKALTDKKGKGRVYLDFLLELRKLVEKNGKKVQFWGDIILNHPELIPELPKDMTALIWGYEADHPFSRLCPLFRDAKMDFYVCPGTSSWNAILGRDKNAFGNLINAAVNGKKYGAKGFLNTDWGDNGHWQPLSVSQPAYLYGAAVSWGVEENKDIDVAHFLNTQLFDDRNNQIGEALIALGNAYLETGVLTGNSNVFQVILRRTSTPLSENKALAGMKKEKLQHTIDFIGQQLEKVDKAMLTCSDAAQVKEEITLAAQLCQHACKQAIYKLEASKGDLKNVPAVRRAELKKELESLLTRYKTLWLVRNRPGGLPDSAGRLVDWVLAYY